MKALGWTVSVAFLGAPTNWWRAEASAYESRKYGTTHRRIQLGPIYIHAFRKADK